MVNHIFNAQILIYTITSLIIFNVAIYGLYMSIRRDILPDIYLILIFVIGNTFRILKIVLISYDCEYTMRQVRSLFLNLSLTLQCAVDQITCPCRRNFLKLEKNKNAFHSSSIIKIVLKNIGTKTLKTAVE